MSTKTDLSLLPVTGRSLIGEKTPKGNFPHSAFVASPWYSNAGTWDQYYALVQGRYIESLFFCQDSPAIVKGKVLFIEIDSPIDITNWFYENMEMYYQPDCGVTSWGITPLFTPDRANFGVKEIQTGVTETNNVRVGGYQYLTSITDISASLEQEAPSISFRWEVITESAIIYNSLQGGFFTNSAFDTKQCVLLREEDYTQAIADDGNILEVTQDIGFGDIDYELHIVGLWKEHTLV